MRENLQLLFPVSTAAEGTVGEGSLDETRILRGF